MTLKPATPLSKETLTDDIERKILDAYNHIHRLGVIHGDIRPPNVLISPPEGSVWIIDFEDAIFDGEEGEVEFERKAVEDMLRKVKNGEEVH